MAGFSMIRARKLAAGFPGRVAIETGTFEANTTRLLLNLFEIVHTIELEKTRFERCQLLLTETRAICHHGNSADIIPELCRLYDEPVFFYLDAHQIAPKHLGPDRWRLPVANSFPLWNELRAIAAHNQPDRIVVDDVHAFGRRETGWRGVRPDRLCAALGRVRFSRRVGDQWVAQLAEVQR